MSEDGWQFYNSNGDKFNVTLGDFSATTYRLVPRRGPFKRIRAWIRRNVIVP